MEYPDIISEHTRHNLLLNWFKIILYEVIINIAVPKLLLKMIRAYSCLTVFSHNVINVIYDEFEKIAGDKGFVISYNGLIIEY